MDLISKPPAFFPGMQYFFSINLTWPSLLMVLRMPGNEPRKRNKLIPSAFESPVKPVSLPSSANEDGNTPRDVGRCGATRGKCCKEDRSLDPVTNVS
mmetsp:Transcript_31917/g.54554  ORF Transcript_31917/g.54554 Transcript_31917/m.54554 type:complete len:97 (-) Transcript_31917:40-330(-)